MRLNDSGYATIGRDYEHVRIAQGVLGKRLPKGAQVHHVNGIRHDNRNENLVVCQDARYHWMLHRRAASLKATGSPHNLRCNICGTWGPPGIVKEQVSKGRFKEFYHRSCRNELQRSKRPDARRYTREAFGY